MEYCLYNPSTGAVTNNYLLQLRSVQVPSDNVEYSIILHLSDPVQVGVTEFCYGILRPIYQIRFNMTFISIHKLIIQHNIKQCGTFILSLSFEVRTYVVLACVSSLAKKRTVLSLLQSEPSYSCWIIFYYRRVHMVIACL